MVSRRTSSGTRARIARFITVSSRVLLARSRSGVRSLDRGAHRTEHEQRLAFLDEIRGKLRRVAGADILRGVDRSGRDEQHLAGLERHRRLTLNLIFP